MTDHLKPDPHKHHPSPIDLVRRPPPCTHLTQISNNCTTSTLLQLVHAHHVLLTARPAGHRTPASLPDRAQQAGVAEDVAARGGAGHAARGAAEGAEGGVAGRDEAAGANLRVSGWVGEWVDERVVVGGGCGLTG